MIIVLSGQLSTAQLWQGQLPALCRIGAVRVFEQTGADHVTDLAREVLATAPAGFSLIAHGMACFTAFEILRRAGHAVRRTALLSAIASADSPAQTARRQGYIQMVRDGRFAEIIEDRLPSLFSPDRGGDQSLVDTARRMAADVGPEAFMRQQRAIMTRPDSRPDLAAIRCPSFIISAEHDGFVSAAHTQEILDGIGHATHRHLQGTGHFMTLERPDLLARILADWQT